MNKIIHDKSTNSSSDYTSELKSVKEYMEANFGERTTLQKIIDKIKIKNFVVTFPSTTTIPKFLKTKLNFSIKKSSSSRIISDPEEIKRRFKEKLENQFYFQQINVEVIYIAQFSI